MPSYHLEDASNCCTQRRPTSPTRPHEQRLEAAANVGELLYRHLLRQFMGAGRWVWGTEGLALHLQPLLSAPLPAHSNPLSNAPPPSLRSTPHIHLHAALAGTVHAPEAALAQQPGAAILVEANLYILRQNGPLACKRARTQGWTS